MEIVRQARVPFAGILVGDGHSQDCVDNYGTRCTGTLCGCEEFKRVRLFVMNGRCGYNGACQFTIGTLRTPETLECFFVGSELCDAVCCIGSECFQTVLSGFNCRGGNGCCEQVIGKIEISQMRVAG